MSDNYIFRKVEKEEVTKVYDLILERIQWMNENNINHWNAHGYEKIFPLTFYEEECRKGNLYGLVDANSNEVVSSAVLLEKDKNWDNDDPSIYVHNFVSKVGRSGAGKIFLKFIEDYAKAKAKKYIRLDSSDDNEKLTEYYSSLGFVPTDGRCTFSDIYTGVLRQKELH